MTDVDVVEVKVPPLDLGGFLGLPDSPRGIVVFVHGSGSSRFSPRNTEVARALRARGFATLLFDLLTEPEARSRSIVFDVGLLAARLADAIAWLGADPRTTGLRIGAFGASTGAAAALVAASEPSLRIGAVVSRGGRPDLAGPALVFVRAPTLLIVGSLDRDVLRLNEQAFAAMTAERDLVVVPGATHLFEEPGTMERVTELAGDWFQRHLAA